MKLVIINYDSGNVASVFNAFEEIKQDQEIIVSNDIQDIRRADFLVLPGVGSFDDCINGLSKVSNLVNEIKLQVLAGKPFLGICVGMQVLASIGYENGQNSGLDLIKGYVTKITPVAGLKVPHMGWNNIEIKNFNHPILLGIEQGDHFYFANSYHFICKNEKNIIANVEYGNVKINSIIAENNIVGVQFHPEKSGEVGLRLLENFLNYYESD